MTPPISILPFIIAHFQRLANIPTTELSVFSNHSRYTNSNDDVGGDVVELLANKPLLLALACVFIAQLLKVPIHYALTRKFDLSLLNSTGGMPSSHSAAVCALATAIGFEHGLDSGLFAVAAMFAVIVMYDASHVRYEAGQHAASINDLYNQVAQLFDDLRTVNDATRDAVIREDLKTLLGHKKSEVYAGCLTGVLVSTLFYTLF